MSACVSVREWLEGELRHLAESRPESVLAMLNAAARLAARTLERLREGGASCRVEGEARVYSDPLRPLDVLLRAYAYRDGGEGAGVCVAFVVDTGKLCESIRGVIEGRGGGEAVSALKGLLEATADALRVYASHPDDVRVADGERPRLILEKCVAVEASPEEAAEKLLFAIRRILEELGVRLE